jgi:uncharacterized protein (TIGR02246 family)
MGTEVPSGPGQYSDAHGPSVGSHLMDVEVVDRWMEAYRAAWISNVPNEVAELFTEDAVYAVSPFAEPWTGRDEIVRRWVAGIRQDVDMTYEVLSVQADQAVIHWHVFTRNVGDPVRVEYDGVLVVRFAPDGRCSEHREWYFRRELPG